ncbi:hypothetical protein BBJ28_00009282 [Nothophytophthora sp. Chile5]|nr:hypothetical protein BBJ28_00009282 [Nothophytophthora sp. Chile5]
MKKIARKNFRGFSNKTSNSTSSNGTSSSSPGMTNGNGGAGGGIMRRATWADKIRDKLPPLQENEYEVLWERGVLGVIFLESEKDGIPYVSKATESCISPAVAQGDILKFVNVVRSKDHSFSDFFKILATMKKPVLLRFERMSAGTPSSDEDDASALFGVQRSSSANRTSSYPRQGSSSSDDGDPSGKFQRANSVPQKDHKPPKATRGAFWRATSAKDSTGPAALNTTNGIGPNLRVAAGDQLDGSPAHNRIAGSRDHQVSPRDLRMSATGAATHSSNSPLGPGEYQVYWETGSLGLFFGEDRATNLPVVTRSTPSANPVVRRAVTVNDTLVSANSIHSADYTFEAFFGRLQQMNKPVRLVFRRRLQNDHDVVVVKHGEQQQQPPQQQQQLQFQQQQQQEESAPAVTRGRKPSVTVDAIPSPADMRMSHRSSSNRTPSPTVKRSPTPPLLPPSPQVRVGLELMGSEHHRRERRHADRGLANTPPPSSPIPNSDRMSVRQQENLENGARSSIKEESPKRNSSLTATPLSSVLAVPASPVTATPEASEPALAVVSSEPEPSTDAAPSPIEPEVVKKPKEKRQSLQELPGKRSRNSSDEPQQVSHQQIPMVVLGADDELAVSPVSESTQFSPTEPWDLPERLSSPSRKAEAEMVPANDSNSEAELVSANDGEVDVAFPASPLRETQQESAAEVEDLALSPLPESEPVADAMDLGVELGVIADVEMGIAIEEEVSVADDGFESPKDRDGPNPWDVESEQQKRLSEDDAPPLRHDDVRPSSGGGDSISSNGMGAKVDFAVEEAESSMEELVRDPDISSDIDLVESDLMLEDTSKGNSGSLASPKLNKSSLNANLSKYKKKGKSSRGLTKLPVLTEAEALTVPLVAPNAVNTTVQVRGRPKPKVTMADTPDSTTYLVKWKESRSIGLQLKEVRFAKGNYPLVTDVCQEPCCELLRHICVGDVIIEINGRNTSTMGVKKTVNFLRTCSKTTLLKLRHGPAFVSQRVSAAG